MWSDSDGERELRCAPALPGAAPPVLVDPSAAPRIAQLNVSKNSRMHIGPKFVSVTQAVHDGEAVRGRGLGIEVVPEYAAGEGRRLRCSIFVFVCWALAVTAVLVVYLTLLAANPPAARLDLGLTAAWYLRRGDWQAMAAYSTTALRLPARYAFIGHSATRRCEDRDVCTGVVLAIQRHHQRMGWDDIGPNFLVSSDGLVFEGRGANLLGTMVPGWNSRGVMIMFLGDFRDGHDIPTDVQLQHTEFVLMALVEAGVLTADYTLFGYCQVVPSIYSPGVRVLERMGYFNHWDQDGVKGCLEIRNSTILMDIIRHEKQKH